MEETFAPSDLSGIVLGDCAAIQKALRAYERGEGKQSRAQKDFATEQAQRVRQSSHGKKLAKVARGKLTSRERAVMRAKVWRLLNPHKHKAATRNWRVKYPEKNAAISRRYYTRHRLRILAMRFQKRNA